jgi:predicted nucleic acid-binding Zn ribbon protein
MPKINFTYVVRCKDCANTKQVVLTGLTTDYFEICEVCRRVTCHQVMGERK